MSRPGGWSRALGYSTAAAYKGQISCAVVGLGATVDRTFWTWNASFTIPSTGAFPPGGSIVRVGLIMLPVTTTVFPSPVSDLGADWMDMMTLPWRGEIATSVDIDYLGFAGFGGPDKESRVRRINTSTHVNALYVCWDSFFAQDVGDAYAFVATATTDAYVLDAP